MNFNQESEDDFIKRLTSAPPASTPLSVPAPSEEDLASKASRDAIKARYVAATDDNTSVDQAKADARRSNIVSAIGQALSGFATANSRARNGGQQDDSVFNTIRGNARQSVEDAIKAKQQKSQGLLSQLQLANDQVKEDTSSRNTKFGQDLSVNQFNLNQEDKRTDNARLDRKEKADENKYQNTFQETVRHNKADEANNENKVQAGIQKGLTDAEEKRKRQGSQALTSTTQLLESARGNPAVAQAERDLQSADKADSLANLYNDPNKLSPQQIQLLASEVAKIAQGGVPTMHELDGLTPGTLQSKFASISSKLVNEPTAANAGEFVKQYTDYTHVLRKDAEKIIKDKYGRVIESRKSELAPNDYQALQDNYINRFKKPGAEEGFKNGNDEDAAALEWVKANPNDPRANLIMQKLKSKGL